MKKKKTEISKLINNFIEFQKMKTIKKLLEFYLFYFVYFFIALHFFQWKEDFSIVADKKMNGITY